MCEGKISVFSFQFCISVRNTFCHNTAISRLGACLHENGKQAEVKVGSWNGTAEPLQWFREMDGLDGCNHHLWKDKLRITFDIYFSCINFSGGYCSRTKSAAWVNSRK